MTMGVTGDLASRALALAETPLHVFNIVALLKTENSPGQKTSIDLVIVKQFHLEESLVSSLRSSGMFESVTVVDPYYSFRNKSAVALTTLQAIVAPRAHCQKHCPEPLIGFGTDYRYLFAGCASIYAMDMKNWFVPQGETVFFEEGEGSYLGNFVKSAACFDREILKRSKSLSRWVSSMMLNIASCGHLRFNVKYLFLYRPDCVEQGVYRQGIDIRPLTPLICGASDVAGLFDAPCKLKADWIFLGSPDVDRSSAENSQSRSLLMCIAKSGHGIVYRRHPRSCDDDDGLPDNIHIEDSHCLWEALCLQGVINNDSVLFGFGSTAQINPARMFGLRPTLVFLHHFLSDGIDRRYAERTYRQALLMCGEDRVFAPITEKELDNLVSKLAKRERDCEGCNE